MCVFSSSDNSFLGNSVSSVPSCASGGRSGNPVYVCVFQVCEVQTSQNDVRDGQHVGKGAVAVKVTASV